MPLIEWAKLFLVLGTIFTAIILTLAYGDLGLMIAVIIGSWIVLGSAA